jgi:UDP-glucose 4-epimerase
LVTHIEKLTGQKLEITSAESRPGDQLVYITDFTQLRLATGWSPEINIHETLRMLNAFWQQNQHVLTGMAAPLTQLEKIAAEPSGSVA